MTDRLTPEREAEITESHPGAWYEGDWRSEYIDSTPDQSAYYIVKHQESGEILAELPDFAGPIALFIADAHEAIPELLAELDAVRKERDQAQARVAELEEARRLEWVLGQGTNPRTPRLCECGHSSHAHTAPAPHSCFAFGKTCPCPAYRQLPHDKAVAQLERNIRAAENR